jgi:hypothetical protein
MWNNNPSLPKQGGKLLAVVPAMFSDPLDVGSVVRPLIKLLVHPDICIRVSVESLIINLVKNFEVLSKVRETFWLEGTHLSEE